MQLKTVMTITKETSTTDRSNDGLELVVRANAGGIFKTNVVDWVMEKPE